MFLDSFSFDPFVDVTKNSVSKKWFELFFTFFPLKEMLSFIRLEFSHDVLPFQNLCCFSNSSPFKVFAVLFWKDEITNCILVKFWRNIANSISKESKMAVAERKWQPTRANKKNKPRSDKKKPRKWKNINRVKKK